MLKVIWQAQEQEGDHYTAKKITGCVARNVMSGTPKYALARKTRGNAFVVDVTDHNYTSKWWELCRWKYLFDQL
jgi:hypothetical protein